MKNNILKEKGIYIEKGKYNIEWEFCGWDGIKEEWKEFWLVEDQIEECVNEYLENEEVNLIFDKVIKVKQIRKNQDRRQGEWDINYTVQLKEKIKIIEFTIDIVEILEDYEMKLQDLRYLTIDEAGNLEAVILDRLVLDEIIENEITNYIEVEKLDVEYDKYNNSYTKKIEDGIISVKAELNKKGE